MSAPNSILILNSAVNKINTDRQRVNVKQTLIHTRKKPKPKKKKNKTKKIKNRFKTIIKSKDLSERRKKAFYELYNILYYKLAQNTKKKATKR